MFLTPVLKLMAEKQASDLFISAGAPMSIKIQGTIMPVNADVLDGNAVRKIAYEMMSPDDQKIFEDTWECNFSVPVPDVGRFRVNVFKQRGNVAMVLRYLRTQTPGLEALRLPSILKDLINEKRGLVLVVGATGSGKSTTLAAMIEHRNTTRGGHILTIEDPIEFVFKHQRCVINQREVGLDTRSYHNALINAMREAPDILMIGEVRDKETLQQALLYAQTGHLCLSTLHANNSYHAMNRIISFYSPENRPALLADLSAALKAVVSQRLVRSKIGGRIPAVEVLLNTRLIADLIEKGKIYDIKETMEKSLAAGSQTFEQSLLELLSEDKITQEEALANADSATNLIWLINNQGASSTGASDKPKNSFLHPEQPAQSKEEGATFTEFTLNA